MPEKTEIVTEPARLKQVIDELIAAPRIALDMESDGFYNYQDQVCIVTLSDEERDWVIDTIELGEASRDLQRLCDKPKLPVLMHSGQNDVLALKRDWSFTFANVQDTSVAAMLLGLQQTGLATLVETYLGLKLEKELQRHDWSRRPIENDHLTYLINDTRHLFKLHDLIEDELKKHDLLEEYVIECNAVAEAEPRSRDFDPERFRKIKGHGSLDDNRRGALKALFAWRDGVAKELNRAAFRVVSESTLLELARVTPDNLDKLAEARGMGEWLVREHGSDILRTIAEGMEAPAPVKPPKKKPEGPLPRRMDQTERDRLGSIKRWREKESESRGVGLQAVLPTAALHELVLDPPADKAALAKIGRIGQSRADRYGDEILRIVGA